MTTTIRSILASSAAIGLASFSIVSAFVLGVAAPATLIPFGLLVVYGVVEIALVSYQGPHFVSPPRTARSETHQPAPAGTVAAFPSAARRELARAA